MLKSDDFPGALLLMRSDIMNLKTAYYFHYRGSVRCTEQEFGTIYVQSS
jgi:hypothetical protein